MLVLFIKYYLTTFQITKDEYNMLNLNLGGGTKDEYNMLNLNLGGGNFTPPSPPYPPHPVGFPLIKQKW